MTPRRFAARSAGLLAVLLAGCAPTDRAPLPPAPQVWITPAAAAPDSTVPPAPTGTAIPSIPPSSPVEIASQIYGERLIRNIGIPALGVSSPVVPVGWQVDAAAGSGTAEWDSPGAAVGWILTSALPDQPGNIILYGHNNMYGAVFKNLGMLAAGDAILLETGQRAWEYRVIEVALLPILAASPADAASYQAYLQPADSPRLTVISCWPPEGNTHRVVVIAEPVPMP
jgi:LPXTG-site transpeptidase (sortase) family protein